MEKCKGKILGGQNATVWDNMKKKGDGDWIEAQQYFQYCYPQFLLGSAEEEIVRGEKAGGGSMVVMPVARSVFMMCRVRSQPWQSSWRGKRWRWRQPDKRMTTGTSLLSTVMRRLVFFGSVIGCLIHWLVSLPPLFFFVFLLLLHAVLFLFFFSLSLFTFILITIYNLEFLRHAIGRKHSRVKKKDSRC